MRFPYTSRVTLLMKKYLLAFTVSCFVAQKLHADFLEIRVFENKQDFSCVDIEWVFVCIKSNRHILIKMDLNWLSGFVPRNDVWVVFVGSI